MEVMSKEKFYTRLDQLLEQNNWTVYRLAKEAGLSTSTIYNLLKRKSEPKMETFLKLVRAFHLTVEEYEDISYEPIVLTQDQVKLTKITNGLDSRDMKVIMAYVQAYQDRKNLK